MQVFFDFLARRAFGKGYAAHADGECRHAPMRYGVYSGKWVEGWDQAALEAYIATREKEA